MVEEGSVPIRSFFITRKVKNTIDNKGLVGGLMDFSEGFATLGYELSFDHKAMCL